MVSYIFGGDTGETQESLKRKRRIAEALMGNAMTPAKNVGEGLAQLGNVLIYRKLMNKIDAGEAAGSKRRADTLSGLYDFPDAPGMSPVAAALSGKKAEAEVDTSLDGRNSALPSSFLAALDKYEGGGSYDTLFGHANRKGQFAGTRVSEMPISDVLAFQDPSGAYAQSVKAQIGRVATPAGRHQIVGKTLRAAANEMGLDPSTPFDAATQDRIALHLAQKRLASAGSLDGKIAALRSEWHGFRNVPNAQMAQIVADIERGGGGAPSPRPVQVASLDPSIGLPEAQEAPQQTAGIFVGRPDQMPPQQAPLPAPRPQQPVPQPAPQQVAQAGPETYGFGPDINSAAGSGARIMQLRRAMANEWLSDDDRAMISDEIKQLQQQNDPSRMLDMDLKRAQLAKYQAEAAKDPQADYKVVNDRLIKTYPDGRVEDVTPDAPEGAGPTGPFSGNSVEAQSLNLLVANGKLTPEQAAQIGAGKPITDPSTGAIIFMTPEGIFQQERGQQPQPFGPQGGGSQLLAPMPLGGSGQIQPRPQQAPAPQPAARPGAIPLTPPKQKQVPDATRNSQAKVNQAFDTIGGELDRYAELVGKHGVEAMPGEAKDNLNSVRQGIMLQMKELFNLGVLNGPDLSLMERMIYDPVIDPMKEGGIANLPGQMWDATVGNPGARAQNSVNELKRMLTNIRDATNRAAAGTVGAPASAPPPAGGTQNVPAGVDPADWEYMTPEERAVFQ